MQNYFSIQFLWVVKSLWLTSKKIPLSMIGFPQEGEANGNGTVSPGIALPGRDALAYYYCGQDFGSNSGDNRSF